MEKYLKIITKWKNDIIFMLILLFIFCLYSYNNIVFAEEIIYNIKEIQKLEIELINCLTNFVKSKDFQDKYANSPIFTLLILKNALIIDHFVKTLDLAYMLNTYKHLNEDEISAIIFHLFEEYIVKLEKLYYLMLKLFLSLNFGFFIFKCILTQEIPWDISGLIDILLLYLNWYIYFKLFFCSVENTRDIRPLKEYNTDETDMLFGVIVYIFWLIFRNFW